MGWVEEELIFAEDRYLVHSGLVSYGVVYVVVCCCGKMGSVKVWVAVVGDIGGCTG